MTSRSDCDRLALTDLADYAAGELSDADAAVIEDHLKREQSDSIWHGASPWHGGRRRRA
jgi:hypothetical protein